MADPVFEIVRPGLFTTVQDLGRTGGEDIGVPPGGAMDARALQASNLMAGNSRSCACLEINLSGPTLRFLCNCRIAVCGAIFELLLDGASIPSNCAMNVTKGQMLTFGRCLRGARAYLAILGGIEAPCVFGSRSTYTPAAIGGFDGRRLTEGDLIFRNVAGRAAPKHRISTTMRFVPESGVSLRCMHGPQYSWFSGETQRAFWLSGFTVSTRADRIGLRLDGLSLVQQEGPTGEMTSEPTPMGTVQVSSDGSPTVLMADRPTIGGYPKIATVISADIPALAQCRAGDTVHFVKVTLDEAYAAGREAERELRLLAMALAGFPTA